MTEPDPRIFRLHEARAMLPRVGAILDAMQQRKRQAQQARAFVDALRRAATGNGGGVHADTREAEARLQAAVEHLQALAAELEEAGVQLKDLDRGLVDWLAEREGRRVLLCWLQGEPTVAWWHELATGFAGRQAVVDAEWE